MPSRGQRRAGQQRFRYDIPLAANVINRPAEIDRVHAFRRWCWWIVMSIIRWLDRLRHSLPHWIETVGGLAFRGDDFRSLTECTDTTTSGGGASFIYLARWGSQSRINHNGCSWAKGGVNPRSHRGKWQKVWTYIVTGLNVREVATQLKISKTALYVILKEGKGTEPPRNDPLKEW